MFISFHKRVYNFAVGSSVIILPFIMSAKFISSGSSSISSRHLHYHGQCSLQSNTPSTQMFTLSELDVMHKLFPTNIQERAMAVEFRNTFSNHDAWKPANQLKFKEQ